MDKQDFRAVCGQFATGVTVITTTYNNSPFGFTANSFTSVSLDPPIVLFCLKTASETNKAFLESKTFAINILSENQETISNAFANPNNNQETRFKEVTLTQNAVPVIEDSLGYLTGTIIQSHEIGDHIVYYGEVSEGIKREGNPLLYAKGGYQRLG